MKRRWHLVLVGLGFAILAMMLLASRREEPVYQGKPLRYWVTQLGSDELHGAPKDATAAIRAIGPKAVPFLLAWMPQRQPRRPAWLTNVRQWCSVHLHISTKQQKQEIPPSDCVEFAWWALGIEGKSAVPALSRVISQHLTNMDDYSAWTQSAKAISFLGPDAIVPMLTAATNMQGTHELWELLHNFENLGTNGGPAVPALLHWAKDPDYFVRSGVVSALGGIGQRADLAVPVLLDALHDPNSMVRRDAANALGAFAGDSDAVLAELIKTLSGADLQARGGVLSGLGRIRSKPETVVPLIAPYLSDRNSVVARSAAYALRDLGSRAGLLALLRTTNNSIGLGGIADIIDDAAAIISGDEEEKRRQDIIAKLSNFYTKGEAAQIPDLEFEGKSLTRMLNNYAHAGPSLRLDQLLSLRQITMAKEENSRTFELPLNYDALMNIGTLRLLCDADPNEKSGSEAMLQEFERATNGNCRLVWDTTYDPPGRHFLQAELVIHQRSSDSQPAIPGEREILLRGPLLPFLSTNELQFFLHADTYTEHGAYFRVKLAQRVGSYSLELTTPSGKHIHTITGSTTNGIAEVSWNLLDDSGKRYQSDSFNSTWKIAFPDPAQSEKTKSTQAKLQP